MEKYVEVHFAQLAPSLQEILIAQLADAGYDGFEQGSDFLTACIAETKFSEPTLRSILGDRVHKLEFNTVEPRNWNEEWERSFEPVIIDGFCAIRASFHAPVKGVQHEIIITPKMSFGTGHHATTSQVVQMMETIDFSNKDVFDFGTGTGVLAILAEKLGARKILAIDNDEWSIENAKENIEANGCTKIKLLQFDHVPSEQTFDIILANINRHVILQELRSMTKQLRAGGVLILSGLLRDDEQVITAAAFNERLIVQTQSQKHDWIAMSLTNC